MRQKIGIGLLIIFNLTFIYIIIMGAFFSFGIIVAELGPIKALEAANLTTNDMLIKLTVLSAVVLLINYFLTKKMIAIKKPFLTSLMILLIGILVFIPFFLAARQSFLNYQNGTTKLQHYLDRQTISEAFIIKSMDTIQVEQLDNFIRDIGYAKYKPGPWKYAKKLKIIFNKTDGNKDSIFTNGQMFGPFKGKYFFSDKYVFENYLIK